MGDKTRGQIAITTLMLVALLAAAPLWGPVLSDVLSLSKDAVEGPGMVNTRGGGDSPFLLQRTHQMLVNLRAGVFPVRWMPDGAYGLGYPFFSYYAALPYYLAGLLALAGLDLLTALKLVQTLGFIAAALAMYGWIRKLTRNQWAAWLAAVAISWRESTRVPSRSKTTAPGSPVVDAAEGESCSPGTTLPSPPADEERSHVADELGGLPRATHRLDDMRQRVEVPAHKANDELMILRIEPVTR